MTMSILPTTAPVAAGSRWLPLLLLLPVLALAWFGGRWWWAERLLVQLDQSMSTLEERRNAPDHYGPLLSIPEWQALDSTARQALSLLPGSAASWTTLSRVQQARNLAAPWPDDAAMQEMDLATLFAPYTDAQAESLQALREAVLRQPVSSQHRVLLASRKVQLGQYDAELLAALRAADQLAPHFIGTQNNLTRLLAVMLPQLAGFPELQDFARSYLQRVLAPDALRPAALLALLRQQNALPQACLLLDAALLEESVAQACTAP